MHICHIHLSQYKRFTELSVDLPTPCPLVMLCGPNGSGKSSLFEALKSWHVLAGPGALRRDKEYLLKGGKDDAGPDVGERITVTFYEGGVQQVEIPAAMYFRTAYRNEAAFATQQVGRTGDILAGPQPERMIDNDSRVSDNYQRVAGQAFDAMFKDADDETLVVELRDRLIGRLGSALADVLPGLTLEGMADPLGGGTFRFAKGVSRDFPYMNLSGGEKAVFDLLLDMAVKAPTFPRAIVCIDEPEAHTNPSVQSRLLDALLDLAGPESQLWLATHSIGILRRARERSDDKPGSVAFLDFGERDFDEPQSLAPVSLSRTFWKRTIAASIGDIADLVAPSTVVLCEGQPSTGHRAEFDARCLRAIFGDSEPDTDFVAVGNDRQVIADEAGAGQVIQTVVPGATVVRLIDRDDRSETEVKALREEGVTSLGRRNLESYLLDEEVLEALCVEECKADQWSALQKARGEAHAESVERGNRPDDWKSIRGAVFNACKKFLELERPGSSADVFLLERLAPRIRPGMAVYDELRHDVFE